MLERLLRGFRDLARATIRAGRRSKFDYPVAQQPLSFDRAPADKETDEHFRPVVSSAAARSPREARHSARRDELIARLGNKASLRDAVLLSDILHKPVSLRRGPRR